MSAKAPSTGFLQQGVEHSNVENLILSVAGVGMWVETLVTEQVQALALRQVEGFCYQVGCHG